ncbi:MAG: TonB-dependent receptor [Woeseia sp.]
MNTFRDQHDRPSLFGLLAALTALLGLAVVANAQDTDDDDEGEIIEEIITTGTPGGGEMRKLDASFSITTANDADIEKFAPKSTADLLKIVPGVWAESSGGVSGANVFVRGFPGAGDAPFLTVQLNGSPLFPPPTLSFLENTTIFRIDETVARVEALRGGPNPVLSNGQPGLTANFILKEGSEETEGLVKYTTSDYDLRRFDAVISGELADELYYMVGGYISSSDGIRETGFNSEEGTQFTINLTKDLDDGSINVYHRVTDDHGTWYLPVALNVPGVDGGYNQVGVLSRQRQIMFDNDFGDPAFPDPKVKTLDLADGRGWDGSVTGGSVRFDFAGDWELVDRFNFTGGNADTLGLVPQGGAVNVGALIADPTIDTAAVITGPLTGAVTGRSISNGEYIQQFGAWEVRKDIESFTNDLSLAKPFDRGKVTVGIYSANSSTDEFWSLGNQKYHVVESGGEIVDGIACNDASVDSCTWNYDIDATGDATTSAVYGAIEYDISDQLTLDFGVRWEDHEVEYSVDEGLDGVVTLAVSTDESEVSWTAALNYALNDSMGVFGRINSGSKMPYFDDYRDNRGAFANANNLINEVDQFEAGFKWVSDYFSLYATAFSTEVDPSFFVALAGQTPGVASTNEAIGLEIDADYFTDFGLSVNLNATIQESEIKGTANDGNEVQRQPGWQLRITPSYDLEVGNADVVVYGTLTAVDDRFSDPGNTVVLDSYNKIDLGAIVTLDDRLSFQIAADNITDDDGLTEGDPRSVGAPNGRFIMPRSVKFSVGYAF